MISPDQDWITRLLRNGRWLAQLGHDMEACANAREAAAIRRRLPRGSVIEWRHPHRPVRRLLVIGYIDPSHELLCEPGGLPPGLGMEFVPAREAVRIGSFELGTPDNPRAW